MSNIGRAKVELKKKHNDPQKNFRDMFQEFKRRVSNSGILHDYKDHMYYESKSEKKRKKRKEAEKNLKMDILEKKILGGEKVKASANMIKKIVSQMCKNNNKKSNNYRQDY